MNMVKNDPLFLNYLKFLEIFRGEVDNKNAYVSVRSEKKEFTFIVSYVDQDSFEASTLLISDREGLNIDGNKWKSSGSLCFMTGENIRLQRTATMASDLTIQSGNSLELIENYSLAQSAGFLETPELYAAWGIWLTNSNRKTLMNKDVTFYVIKNQKIPIAGAFTVKTDSSIGIYGVATDPNFRKQGFATVILERILSDFQNTDVIGLQVEEGSYAHRYYKNLNFREIYKLKRYQKREL